MESVIQWVECSRCQKWRIIHPMPDGTEEIIPDVWFCEMNRDTVHNTCEAPEEEYKAPEAPIIPFLPVVPPNMNRLPRPAKSNDPDSIRAKLKLLTNEELQAAFETVDLERVFEEEFGDNLETARSHEFFSDVSQISQKPQVGTKSRPQSSTKKEVDVNQTVQEIRSLTKAYKGILPQEISCQLPRNLH